ncbi:MAG: hypothetical protein Q7S31_01570 [bacterium]|nr:hypothetical protein [bacterium]
MLPRLALILVGFVLIYFTYIGLTTLPWEGDSLAYHLPISELIIRGKIFGPQLFSPSYFYYPATAETLLAGMLKVGLPANLFNMVGWIILFLLCRKLGGTVFAAAIVLLPSVVRLISTQTVDIWLAVFWLGSWLALVKRHPAVGLLLGLLSGTKYSGLLYAAVLWLFYSREISLNLILGWLVGGGFWYVRNWMWMGNPVYPATVGIWPGDPQFKLLNWPAWMTVVRQPVHFLVSLISEFLIWPIAILATIKPQVSRLMWLAAANFGVYLILPSWPENTLSDLRYVYPAVIPAILAVFRVWPRWAEIATFVSGLAVLTQLNYHPKLFVVYILLVSIWSLRKS